MEYETRFLPCRVCDGAGEWDEGPLPASSGASEPEYRQVICGQCEGSGVEEQEVEPSEIEDTIPAHFMPALWLENELTKARRNIEYHMAERAKEVERAAGRTRWIRTLLASLPESPHA